MERRKFLDALAILGAAPILRVSGTANSPVEVQAESVAHLLAAQMLSVRQLRMKWTTQVTANLTRVENAILEGEQELTYTPAGYRITFFRREFRLDEICEADHLHKELSQLDGSLIRRSKPRPTPPGRQPFSLLHHFLPTLDPNRAAEDRSGNDAKLVQGRWELRATGKRVTYAGKLTSNGRIYRERRYQNFLQTSGVEFPTLIFETWNDHNGGPRLSFLHRIETVQINESAVSQKPE
jgi:hypothetical protein